MATPTAPATKPAARKRAASSPAAAPAAPEAIAAAPVADEAPTVAAGAPPAATKPEKAAKPARPMKPAKDEKATKAPKAVKTARPEKAEKAAKPAKIKLVRDSFTMPEGDYAQLALLKQRCLKEGVAARKSELLRLGLAVLATLPAAELAGKVAALEKLKTGRPARS